MHQLRHLWELQVQKKSYKLGVCHEDIEIDCSSVLNYQIHSYSFDLSPIVNADSNLLLRYSFFVCNLKGALSFSKQGGLLC